MAKTAGPSFIQPTPNTKRPPLTTPIAGPALPRTVTAGPALPTVTAGPALPAVKAAKSPLLTPDGIGSRVMSLLKPLVAPAMKEVGQVRKGLENVLPAMRPKAIKQPVNRPLTSQPRPAPTPKVSPGGLRGNAASKLGGLGASVANAAMNVGANAAHSVSAVSAGPPQGQSMMGEAARNGMPQAPTMPAAAPQAPTPPNGTGGAPATPQGAMPTYQPQAHNVSGLGDGYDAVHNAEIDRENQRGAAYGDAQRELDMPTKADFTTPWDKNDAAFGVEYADRKQRMKDQFTEQLNALQSQYGAQQGRINTAQSTGQAGITGAVGNAATNVANYGTAPQAAGTPINQDQYLQGLGAAGGAQQASLASAGPAPTNLATSALTPEILAASQAQHAATLNARASSASNASQAQNNTALQRAYEAQGGTENDLLKIYGQTGTANTNGRTGSIADYYTANRGAVDSRNKLLDNQYAKSNANDRAAQDIASGGRNFADNVTSDANNQRTVGAGILNNNNDNVTSMSNNDADNLVSRANNGDTNATRLLTQGMSSEAAAERNAASIRSREGGASYTGANRSGTKASAPKLIKGDTYVATRLGNSPQTAALVRDIGAKAKAAASSKKLPDGSANGMYGRSYDEILKSYWTAHPDQAKTAQKHVMGYLNGEMYAAPKGNAASGGGSTGGGTSAASAAYKLLKSEGQAVDGLGSSSAAHRLLNPHSDHDTGKAFDWHVTGPKAVQEAMRIPGVRYLINQQQIFTKDASGGWTAKPYVGNFASGKPKDHHANHIHVNF